MLSPEDRSAIEDLFERLHNVERNSAPRDAEAEDLIMQYLRRSPQAAYYMAQTIVVQEAALRAAQNRISELEQSAPGRGGGFLDSIFGSGARDQGQRRSRGPWDRDESEPLSPRDRRGGGGGFLAGAAQTALGVTGGVLLGSAIAGMLGGTEAQAAETAPPEDQNMDASGGDDGGDWGSDFDIGGDF